MVEDQIPLGGEGNEEFADMAQKAESAAEQLKEEAAGAAKPSPKKSSTGKIFSIFAWILVGVLAIAGGYFFYLNTNLEKENTQLKTQLDDTLEKKAAVESELREAIDIRDELEEKAETAQRQADRLAAQIEQEKRAKESALIQLQSKLQEAEDAKRESETHKKKFLDLEGLFKKIKKENTELKEQVDQLKISKRASERKKRKVSSKRRVKLDKIVVKPEEAAPDVEGQVLVVNREFDFIVVNLGQDDGMKTGALLEVSRGGKILGRVEVEKIYGNMSAAIILPDTNKDKLKEGDSVRPL